MASIFHTVYESNDSTYSTRNFYAEYPSLEDIEIEPCQFKATKLSESLATISNLCYEGFKNIEDVPEVLNKLRNTILESMIYCIRIERSSYDEYIQALSRKINLFMERIVLEVLRECQDQENFTGCFFIVKAIHDVVLLMYSFTNPLKIPDSLSGTSAISAEGHMSSFKIEDIFEATKELHAHVLCFSILHDTETEESGSTSTVNNTPKKLFKDEATDIMNYLAKINLVVINNCVPTVNLFYYFESVLHSDSFSLLELEYFEEFLSHFARIDKFCRVQENTALFDRQKQELQTPFFQMIQINPFRKSNWCTSLQAVNYLQIFVDLYNEIYEEGLILERLYSNETGQESTVVRRIVDDHVAKACDCPQDHAPATPDFVNFFSSSVVPDLESSPDLGDQENSLEYDKKGAYPGSQICNKSPNLKSPLPKSRKIFQLNEQVAYELRDLRSSIEEKYRVNKVTFKENKCLKCKYLPWHKHVYG
ncbi:hypothetical protein JCM33374_g3396 [Metschnikowia sp. JCM 33374]|nr:hypothetical protein JCM33374_g3396 [Metschnikowia sp. JCM 33374]